MYTRLSSLLQGQRDSSFFTDFAERIAESKVKDAAKVAEEKGYQKGLKEGKAAKAAQEPVGPGAGVLAPGSSAGSGKVYSQMTAAERNALTSEQRDAAVARENAM